MSNDLIEIPKFSEMIPAEKREEILRIMAGMSAGGWQVTADGKARAATKQEQFVLALVASRYGLDPLMGDIYLMGGKPYPAYKALYRAAVERGFRVESRPMTHDERELYGLDAAEHGFVAAVYNVADRKVSNDFGTACKDDVAIARNGDKRILRIMAQKRAERRAIDKAMGITTWDSDDPIQGDAIDVRPGAARTMAALLESSPSAPAPTATAAPPTREAAPVQGEVKDFGTLDRDAPFDGEGAA